MRTHDATMHRATLTSAATATTATAATASCGVARSISPSPMPSSWARSQATLRASAYLVLGPATGTMDLSLADAEFEGEQKFDEAGLVSGAGDVDGDGRDDILIGAPRGSGDHAGAAYLVLGPVTGSLDLSLADAKLLG